MQGGGGVGEGGWVGLGSEEASGGGHLERALGKWGWRWLHLSGLGFPHASAASAGLPEVVGVERGWKGQRNQLSLSRGMDQALWSYVPASAVICGNFQPLQACLSLLFSH